LQVGKEGQKMKSNVHRIVELAVSEIGMIFLLLALAVGIASIPAHAEENAWSVDAEHSVARLSLGSGSKSVEVGIARVSGNVAFSAEGAADPVVNLNLAPEQIQGADPVDISFKSKRSMMTNDGQIAVVGDLTVTRVERSEYLDPNEGYYGPTYGDPVSTTATREVTLLLPANAHPELQNASMQISASTKVSREYFPQLLNVISPGNWSNVVVQDENCTVPAVTGEGYYGATGTGTPVETATNSVAPSTPTSGEGYYGFEPAVIPDGGQATIAFDLKLTRTASAPNAVTAGAQTAGN
jgi:hypothetical protein